MNADTRRFNAAFWRWFKDSKVVDAKGQPLTVYHWASGDVQFTEFRPGFDTGMIWFSEHPDAFEGMMRKVPVYRVYLRIENPLELEGAYSDYTLSQWKDILEEAGVNTADLRFDSALSDREEYPFGSLIQHGDNYLNRDGNLAKVVQDSGFDGIRAPSEDPLYRGETNWVAFSPTQIKSATDNLGTWDGTDPDIRHNPGYYFRLGRGMSGGGLITPSARRPGWAQVTWFTEDGEPRGHEEYETLVKALAQYFGDLDHPVAQIMDRRSAIKAWEEATFAHPYRDELMDMSYAYVSPLRPLSGVSVEGRTSADLSGRIGVLYRDTPLTLDILLHLNLAPLSPAAVQWVAHEIAEELAL